MLSPTTSPCAPRAWGTLSVPPNVPRIEHLSVPPQERMALAGDGVGLANHAAGLVNRAGAPARASEGPEVPGSPGAPQHGVEGSARRLRETGDLAQLVDGQGPAPGASEGAEVAHRSPFPQEGMAPAACGEGAPHHLPGAVDGDGLRAAAAEVAEIEELAARAEGEGDREARREQAEPARRARRTHRHGDPSRGDRLVATNEGILTESRMRTCPGGGPLTEQGAGTPALHPAGTAGRVPCPRRANFRSGHPARPPRCAVAAAAMSS